MPCYDSRRDEHPSGESWSTRAERLQKRCDVLTRLLCEAMTIVEGAENTGGDAITEASRELREWWTRHKQFDKQRKRKHGA